MIRQIPGYPSYSVTDDGRVWTHRLRSGWMKPGVDRNGYIRFGLIAETGGRKGMYIHQLVALAYIPNPENKPFVNHKDHDKANNAISNLEWCTHLENIRHDWAMGTRKPPPWGEENWSSKYTTELVQTLRDLFDSGKYNQSELARKFKMPQPTVHVIVRRKQWREVS